MFSSTNWIFYFGEVYVCVFDGFFRHSSFFYSLLLLFLVRTCVDEFHSHTFLEIYVKCKFVKLFSCRKNTEVITYDRCPHVSHWSDKHKKIRKKSHKKSSKNKRRLLNRNRINRTNIWITPINWLGKCGKTKREERRVVENQKQLYQAFHENCGRSLLLLSLLLKIHSME